MPASDLVNISGLMDDAKCVAPVRQNRWPEGARCPGCDSPSVTRDGCDNTQPCRQRYRCKACASRFDDLTGTVLAGHHQPLRVWVLCLCFMGWHGAWIDTNNFSSLGSVKNAFGIRISIFLTTTNTI